MKKFIIYFGGTLAVFTLICLLVVNSSKTVDHDKKYFLESGDTIVSCVTFSRDTRMNFETSDLLFGDGPIESIKIQNDSIFAVGDETYDKYGEKSSEAPLTFVATFNKEGIVNTKQLINFVNAIDSSDVTITKITVK